MELSEEKKREYTRRLMLARTRLLCKHGFYGLLLMHVGFSLTDQGIQCGFNGDTISFNPTFLDKISDSELDYVLMHEVLHIALHHGKRRGGLEQDRFNNACDIVVNSTILQSSGMDEKSITLLCSGGVQRHTAPDGREGYQFTAEELYALLPSTGKPTKGTDKPDAGWDDHGQPVDAEQDEIQRDVWARRFEDACKAISIRDPSNEYGLLPVFAQRRLKELRKAQTDWRTILQEFVQEEMVDYSFAPPDRRFADGPFFLPDFNEKEGFAKDVLFMIDTSGSMSEEMITVAYSEVKGAIDQFDGKLQGWLGFFDAAVVEPRPFENEEELRVIRPTGGGGTDYQIIFEYVAQHMTGNPPLSIIILSDGYAPFPQECVADGIPVLWLLNNEEVQPPWGKTGRIKV